MLMLINGEKVPAASGKTFDNINPATGKVVCTVPQGGKEDFERAAVIAKAAQPAWAATPFYKRAELIYRYTALVREHVDEIAEAACAEGGKRIEECRDEVLTLCMVFETFTEAAHHLYGSTIPLKAESRTENDIIFTVHEPLGVLVAITPFNFPIELYAHKVAPALVTGNAVISKPASDTPLATYLLTELLWEAGVPGGVMQLVTGSGKDVGDWLAETKNVDAVSFTGSTAVGSSLLASGAKEIRRTFLELGGNDPFVIFPDADLDLAVSEAIGGRAHNAGQVCCASKRFIVHKDVKDAFAEKLVAALAVRKLGDPADPANDMGPLINEKAAEKAMADIAHTIDQGAVCLLGNRREGAYVWPTVLDQVSPASDVAKDLEIFAAVFPLISFETFDEALRIANQTSFGLASTVMTKDMKTAIKFATSVKAGTCVVNGTGDYRSVHQAFGGYKHSGLGREGTSTTLREVTQEKNIALKDILR